MERDCRRCKVFSKIHNISSITESKKLKRGMQKRQICENLSFVSMGFTLLNSLCPLEKYSLVSYFSFYRLAIPAFLLSMVPVTVDCGNELTCFWKLRSTRSCQGLSSPVAHSQQELCQWFQVNCFP